MTAISMSGRLRAVLERYRPEFNGRFAVAPHDATPAWRPVRRGVDLDRVCSFGYEDHCTPASKEFGNRDLSQASAVPLPVMGLFHLMGLFYLMG